MTLLTPDDQARVSRAIDAAEVGTAGEIVCIVARSASEYRSVPLIWAAIAALALPMPLLRLTTFSAEVVHLLQLAGFMILAAVLWLLPWRFALVPRFVMRHRARLAAREQFVTQGLYRTAARTGCLIYVAEAEHYVEVLADAGIASKVDPEIWRQTVEVLTDALKRGQAGQGLVDAVALCGTVLARHCPPVADDRNELPNRLILL